MSFDLSSLTAYTEQNADHLVSASLFNGKTVGLLTPQLGIKSSETINIVDTDAEFQEGSGCGFNPSGSTSISQRTLSVGRIKVNESLCPKILQGYFIQQRLPLGSRLESLPFEQVYTEMKAGKIAEQLETAVWQGDTAGSDPNLNKFDGLLKIIEALSGFGLIEATPSGAITGTNVKDIVKEIYSLIPARVIDKQDLRLFMGWDAFRTLLNKLTDDNLVHYSTDQAAKTGELVYPGTTLHIVAAHGLNGTNKMVAARLSNLFFGTDMMHEEERFEIFFAKEADEVRFICEFKAGVQIAFATEIVLYKAS